MTTVVLTLTSTADGKLTASQEAALKKFGEDTANYFRQEITEIMQQYPGLDEGGASNVAYLRTRSRHSPGLELRLVEECKAGVEINMNEWPPERFR